MTKAIFRILLFLCAAVAQQAATITGPIYLAYSNAPYVGPILFRPLSTPLPFAPQLITGGDFKIQPATNGVFTVDLAPGNYRVTVGSDKAFVIDVPTNAATYTLLERVTNSLAWNSAISPRTNSYSTANNTIEGTVRTYTTQAAPVVWTTNDTAALGTWLGDYQGFGSPEGVVTAGVGSVYKRRDGSTSAALYIKESGTGNTGWVAYGPPGAGGVVPSRQVASQNSITGGGDLTADRTLSLVGDAATPGTNMVYGTGKTGSRGWQIRGYVSPRHFGAQGNFNATANTGNDDTAAFQAALNYSLANGVPFQLEEGIYQTTQTLTVSNGFTGTIDFGNFNPEQAAGTKAPIVYLNATNTHFLTLLDPSRVTIKNLALYIKPQNGWQSGSTADYDSQPQQNDNAYCMRIVGWGTFCNFENIHCLYGSGLIKNDFDTLLTPRAEARLFNNMGRNLMTRYGRYALDLVAGSGSSWENLYFMTSSGGYTNQTAVSAIRVQQFMNNETIKRANFEWSSFTGPMLDMSSAEVHFEGMHVEGVNLPYQSSSARWLIEINGGSFTLSHSRIQDVRADWGFVTKQGLFYLRGSPNTRLCIFGTKIERLNENPDSQTYKLVRYIDTAGGAADIQVDQLDESDVGYWTNSPSWYGFDERRLPASKRFESYTQFGTGLNEYSIHQNGSPPEISYVSSVTNAVGILRIPSGTTEFNARALQQESAGVFLGSGVHRMRFRFKLSSLPVATTDDVIVRVGFMSDISASPQNAPTDGAFVQLWYGMGYGDDRLALVTRSGGSESKTQLFPASYTEAEKWIDVEIIVNGTGDQVRAYGRPRSTTYQANLTSNLPGATTKLIPTIQIVKRGATPTTNVQLDLDYSEVLSAPNGIY